MRGHTGVVFVLVTGLVVGFVYLWAQRPAPPEAPALPVPAFTERDTVAPVTSSVRRTTLLPTDCAELLTGPVDASALLGQPVGALGVSSVVGVASPGVGLRERLTCTYARTDRRGPPALVMAFAAFDTPEAAQRQRERNLPLETTGARGVRDVPLGAARATLVAQPAQHILMVALDRCTVTVRVDRGLVPDEHAEPVLTDLARRAWSSVAPPPAADRATLAGAHR